MKVFYGILIGLIIFLSCSNDDNLNSRSKLLVGTWKPIKEVLVESAENEGTYNFSTCEQKTRITFYSDGTHYVSGFQYFGEENCYEVFQSKGTWTLSGDNFSMTDFGETIDYTFFQLSNDTLQIGHLGDKLTPYIYREYIRVE